MKKKAAYFLFSLLVVLSGTFGISSMAFCTMKAPAPQHSCCKPPVAVPLRCPICMYNLNKVEPSRANTSIKSLSTFQHIVTLLSNETAIINSPDLVNAEYSVRAFNNSSPPLYHQNQIFRLWGNPFNEVEKERSFPCRMLHYSFLNIRPSFYAALLLIVFFKRIIIWNQLFLHFF